MSDRNLRSLRRDGSLHFGEIIQRMGAGIVLLDQLHLKGDNRFQFRVLPSVGALKIAKPFARLLPFAEPALEFAAEQDGVGKLLVSWLHVPHRRREMIARLFQE